MRGADNPVIAALGRRLRLGVVGGGPGSFIGPVHRAAARLDDRYEFLETPFQSELRRKFELEDDGPPLSSDSPEPSVEPTREQRLAALRRRGKAGDET